MQHWSKGRVLFNGYGPTETTIVATTWRYDDESPDVLIGKPIINTEIHLLDQHMNMVPVGVKGELCVSGDSLARGYLGRPELTAERFVPNPFSRKSGARLYRTGDVCRYKPSGEIEHVGRVDQQVKVRGYRIELGEIETVLLSHPAVREAVVLAHEDEGRHKRVVAYLTLRSEVEAPRVDHLREYLASRMPAYMVPSALIVVDEFKRTPSDKIDRLALAALKPVMPEGNHTAPRTPIEEMLVNRWSELLEVPIAGIEEDFFQKGGHSLLATRVISWAREVFGIELPLRSLFERSTISEFAAEIEERLRGGEAVAAPPLRKVERDANLPLSFAQQRLWFLNQVEPDSSSYNVPLAIQLQGNLDLKALEQTLSEIVRRHEVLRTTFRPIDGQPVQVISPPYSFHLEVEQLQDVPESERWAQARLIAQEEAGRPFDLSREVFRVRLVQCGEVDYLALLTMHHIVGDAWSMSVLINEVAALYRAFSRGERSTLPDLAGSWGASFRCSSCQPTIRVPQCKTTAVQRRCLSYPPL
jgi:hypothetical protein